MKSTKITASDISKLCHKGSKPGPAIIKRLDNVAMFLERCGLDDEVDGRYEAIRFSKVGAALALIYLDPENVNNREVAQFIRDALEC